MIGQKFHRLTVIATAPPYREPGGRERRRWLCKCDCGNTTVVHEQPLLKGTQKACGCLRTEKTIERSKKHGHAAKRNQSPTYRVWCHIIGRCTNPWHRQWRDYGGRGITVCDRWRDSFEAFLADMGERPSQAHSIDRYPDNNGGYRPGNCRWATMAQQSRNKRTNRLLRFPSGELVPLKDAAARVGLTRSALESRLKRGWTLEEALATPRLERRDRGVRVKGLD